MTVVPEETVVAAAQFAPIPRRTSRNLAVATELIREAAARGARLVVLPEYCLSGYDADWFKAGAPGGGSTIPGPSIDALARVGAEAGVAVVVGDLERAEGRLFSTSVILAAGRLVSTHRKITITSSEEAVGIVAGDAPAQPVALPGVCLPVAPLICFEHGFPEIALDLALAGAGILAISSMIRVGYEYLRNLRTRARAQDNGMYVVAANAAGEGYCGESMIVDPRGDVLVRASTSTAEVITATVSAALVAHQRRVEPVLARRRPELRAARVSQPPPSDRSAG
jgi:predicted amidohydrolase